MKLILRGAIKRKQSRRNQLGLRVMVWGGSLTVMGWIWPNYAAGRAAALPRQRGRGHHRGLPHRGGPQGEDPRWVAPSTRGVNGYSQYSTLVQLNLGCLAAKIFREISLTDLATMKISRLKISLVTATCTRVQAWTWRPCARTACRTGRGRTTSPTAPGSSPPGRPSSMISCSARLTNYYLSIYLHINTWTLTLNIKCARYHTLGWGATLNCFSMHLMGVYFFLKDIYRFLGHSAFLLYFLDNLDFSGVVVASKIPIKYYDN